MKTIKSIFILLFILGFNTMTYSQAKKPTIMVVPSDNWCDNQGFMMEFDNQGIIERMPDYSTAFVKNGDLSQVIAKIGEMMSERGFPLERLESALKNLKAQSARAAVRTNKSGASVAENPIDALKKTAKADIWIELWWEVKSLGPKKSVNFRIEGIDAYTGKQVANGSGSGDGSISADISLLLTEAVLNYIDNFNAALQRHFDDMFENGREITFNVQTWDDDVLSDGLETEFDGRYLSDIIETWVAENTVQGRFNLDEASDTYMSFKQVRIPLYEGERALDTRTWGRGLAKALKDQYKIEANVDVIGLGRVEITMGGK
jgi:hypothetical protein